MRKNQKVRLLSLVERAIENTKLDLKGLTVLTEVGSNLFVVSPIISLMAGAQKTIAFTRDSIYGSSKDNIALCREIIEEYGLETNRVEFIIDQRPEDRINQADIVTNLGFVRPLDKWFLSHLKQDAVIPLMCEAWEIRNQDIDIEFCKQKQIRVAGTWENHPSLKIFDACGYLAAKIIFEAGFEIYQNSFVIYSPDHFGEVIFNTLIKFGPKDIALIKDPNLFNSEKKVTGADFIFISDYTSDFELLGTLGVLNSERLIGKSLIHLAGQVNKEYAVQNGISVYPEMNGHPKRMTRTLSHLGPKFIVDLHTAGLKVGELMIKKSNDNLIQYLW